MEAQIRSRDAVVCPFCSRAERSIFRREVKTDHRILNFCRCLRCGQHYEFAEDKAGKASVRKR